MAHEDARDLTQRSRAHGIMGRDYAERVSPALPAWLRRPSPLAIDLVLTLLVGLQSVGAAVDHGADEHKALVGAIFGLAVAAPIAVRRRAPLRALAVVIAAAIATPVDVSFQPSVMILLYTIGSTRSWEAAIAAVGAIVAAGAIYAAAGGSDFGGIAGLALLCVVASGVGLYVRSKRVGMATLRERAEQLAREQDLLAERAVAEERVRIAQELHDVVGHNVSLIVVQAQALGATTDDDRVRAATDGIADLGRQTMAEMHRTLKLLRGGRDTGAPFEPQPGLADLDELLSRSRAAGVDVQMTVAGTPRRLAQSVDLSAFRIVQEALTNVVKHAGRARTNVVLDYGADALELTIVDDGAGRTRNGSGAPRGHGLVGMRERAALFGGTLSAGPRVGSGFEVRASLPYNEEDV
jgi:signal transduction histidine kinase